ncbi:MAG: serine hydrolase, partial [Actinomycetota bacterium]
VGEVDGVRVMSAEMVERARAERVNAPDKSLILPTRFGSGFMLDMPFAPLLTPESFGHPGAGGSLGYADPVNEVGYGYVMNEMHSGISGDPRTVNLNNAVNACL